MPISQLSAKQLQNKLQESKSLFLLDVREPLEYQYAHIAGSYLIPLGELPDRLDEIDRAGDVVVLCHHGIRSQQACAMLMSYGFDRVFNLYGGIDAWSIECDAMVARY